MSYNPMTDSQMPDMLTDFYGDLYTMTEKWFAVGLDPQDAVMAMENTILDIQKRKGVTRDGAR